MIMFISLLVCSMWIIYPVLDASIVIGDLPTKKTILPIMLFLFAIDFRNTALKSIKEKE